MTGWIISTKGHLSNQGCRFGGWMELGDADRQAGMLPWAPSPAHWGKACLAFFMFPLHLSPLEQRFSLVTRRVRIVWGTIFSHANIQITEMIIYFLPLWDFVSKIILTKVIFTRSLQWLSLMLETSRIFSSKAVTAEGKRASGHSQDTQGNQFNLKHNHGGQALSHCSVLWPLTFSFFKFSLFWKTKKCFYLFAQQLLVFIRNLSSDVFKSYQFV